MRYGFRKTTGNQRLKSEKDPFATDCQVSRLVKMMSVNDEVKIIWKTNGKWRDCDHWIKRKEIMLKNIDTSKEEHTNLPLSQGDPVKVKFGSR